MPFVTVFMGFGRITLSERQILHNFTYMCNVEKNKKNKNAKPNSQKQGSDWQLPEVVEGGIM